MSMEINGGYSHYKTDYVERLEADQEKVKETEKVQEGGKTSGKTPALQDEYISSEKSGAKPSGLYRLGQDENGKRKVFFDDPKKSGGDKGKNSEVKSASSEKSEEKCTANTDKVEREIRKLKENQQQLEQQIRAASGDEEKVRELERKLAQVEGELSQKDNDAYRKQNASVSYL